MKILKIKIFGLLSILIVIIAGCNFNQKNQPEAAQESKEQNANVVVRDQNGNVLDSDDISIKLRKKENAEKIESDLNTDNWKVFENKEAGISFRYPENLEINVSQEIPQIDKGKLISIGLFNRKKSYGFNFSFTSADFGQGVSEGCCFIYGGEKVDLSVSDEELVKVLEPQLGKVYRLQRGEIGIWKAIRFIRKNSYVDYWLTDSLLIPLDNEIYTNLLISGTELKRFTLETSEKDIDQYVSGDFTLSESQLEIAEIFNGILSTLEFQS